MQRREFLGFATALAALVSICGGCESEQAKIKAAEEASKTTAPPPPGKPPLTDKTGKPAGPQMPHL